MMNETPAGRPFFEVLERRMLVVVFTAIVGAILVGALVLKIHTKYGAMSHVLLINDQAGRDPVTAGPDMPTLATSTSVITSVKQKLHLGMSVSDLQKGVSAHVAPRSSIMTIAYRSADRAQAVAVPNAVADAFVNFYSGLPSSRSASVIGSLGSDLAEKRSTVLSLERKLEQASAGHSYVGSQTSLDNVARELSDLRASRGQAYAQLIADRSDLANDGSESGKMAKIVRHEMLNSNPIYHQMQLGVANDKTSYTTFRAGVTDQFPGISGYKAKIDNEEKTLAVTRQQALDSPDAYSPSQGGQIVATDKARAAVAGDAARVSALDTQIAQASHELDAAASTSGTSLGAIRAQRDAAEAQYQALALRYTNAQSNAAESNSLGRAVVVDRAIKAEPSLIGPNLILGLGLVLVLALAIASAFIAELVNPRVLAPRDAETVYGTPSLATLRK